MKRIYCEGVIAASEDGEMLDFFGIPNMTPEKLRAALTESMGEDTELWINSYGGDIWAAMVMYSELQKHEGKLTSFITGLSASAATILMLGCDEVVASIGAQFMFHNAQTEAAGDYHDMYVAADQLKSANDGISAVYVKKTGKSYDEIKNLMNRTTWLSAQEALDNGFVDRIETFEKERLVASAFNINQLRTKYRDLTNNNLENRGGDNSCKEEDSTFQSNEADRGEVEEPTQDSLEGKEDKEAADEMRVAQERINIERRRFYE